jgi:hypothetical protein
LVPAARTLISTSPALGGPTGVSISASTSGPPNAVATTALVIPELATASFSPQLDCLRRRKTDGMPFELTERIERHLAGDLPPG